ncbi:unnamed protein product [Cylicocyclus nassatus]|uniref:Secreted protein n=1 Tax=Cylicocyclus nassatus TaxID=53992 RepID=A0AA36HH16_CYLNA|nr:unnamed protein product [Cylicocyclus nassatus]
MVTLKHTISVCLYLHLLINKFVQSSCWCIVARPDTGQSVAALATEGILTELFRSRNRFSSKKFLLKAQHLLYTEKHRRFSSLPKSKFDCRKVRFDSDLFSTTTLPMAATFTMAWPQRCTSHSLQDEKEVLFSSSFEVHLPIILNDYVQKTTSYTKLREHQCVKGTWLSPLGIYHKHSHR